MAGVAHVLFAWTESPVGSNGYYDLARRSSGPFWAKRSGHPPRSAFANGSVHPEQMAEQGFVLASVVRVR